MSKEWKHCCVNHKDEIQYVIVNIDDKEQGLCYDCYQKLNAERMLAAHGKKRTFIRADVGEIKSAAAERRLLKSKRIQI